MATTLSSATMTVRVVESIKLNGTEQGAVNTKAFSGINEISKRILTITTAESTIATFSAATASAGHYIAADVRYIRFTNKDDTNFITLTFRSYLTNLTHIKKEIIKTYMIICMVMMMLIYPDVFF